MSQVRNTTVHTASHAVFGILKFVNTIRACLCVGSSVSTCFMKVADGGLKVFHYCGSIPSTITNGGISFYVHYQYFIFVKKGLAWGRRACSQETYKDVQWTWTGH